MRTCSVENCSEKHLANGLCNRHYQRKYKYGRTGAIIMRGSAVERILAKSIRMENGCLIYRGRLTKKGYAHVRSDCRKMRFAHVIMFEHHHGPVPAGLELDHTCRNRSCVEHSHLEPVTHAENVRRGRAGSDFGIRQRNACGQFATAKDKGFV